MKKIGIFEDDEVLGKELKYFLETNGYEARWVEPSEYIGKKESEVVDFLVKENLHLLLLDVGLPGLDGLHLCKSFRDASDVPVIMITSNNSELTELLSINNGADDFVAKPFSPQILVAHMESVMKRVYKENKSSDVMTITQEITKEDGRVISRSFTLEVLKGRVTYNDEAIELSKNELQMLKALAMRQGEIVSRDDIINSLWDSCMFVDDNTLTVNMTRLKGKLDSIGIDGAIVTKRGMGYILL